MKGYLLILSLLAVFICACDNNEITSVQSESFIKYYSLNRFNEGACVCEIPGGGYALLGNTTTDLWGSEICLIFTDVFGNSTQDPKFFGQRNNDKGYCIKPAPGGGYVILGSTEVVKGDKEVLLIRTNDLGDTLWTKIFDQNYGEAFDKDNEDDEGLWFDFNSKGDITMVGYSKMMTIDKVISKQIWICDADQDGNQFDSHNPKTLGGNSDVDEARFIERIDGDNFLITGISNLVDPTPAASYSIIIYLKSSYSDLELIESRDYITEKDTSTLRDEANCLTLIDNNTLLLCGSRLQISGTSEAYLCKFNKIFNDENKLDPKMEWIRYYNNAGGSKATYILKESNSINILSTIASGTDKSSTITVIATDLEGNYPAFTSFGGSSQMKSCNFSFTADGGFIISGTNANKDIYDISSMTLIKTKAGGKL